MNIDYFPYLNADALISLKAMQSCVDDTVTLRCMLNFAKRLLNDQIISQQQYNIIYQEIITKSFNATGYDLLCNPQNSREVGIVAEVKCYIPAGRNGVYGGNQKHQIDTDINGLHPSSTKAQNAKVNGTKVNINGYLKFLVLMNHGGLCTNAIQNIMTMQTKANQRKYPQLVAYSQTAVQQATQSQIFVVSEDI